MTSLRTKAHRVRRARRIKPAEVAGSIRCVLRHTVDVAGGAETSYPIDFSRLEALAQTLPSATDLAAFLVRTAKGERFDWVKAFSPTPDLPAATDTPELD